MRCVGSLTPTGATTRSQLVLPKTAIRVLTGLLALAHGVLVVLVLRSPGRFIYDEPPFVEYVHLLRRYGLSSDFMNSLTGTVGPLYAFVQGALVPLTGLQPVGMRLVNVALLVAVATVLAGWLLHRGSAAWAASALSVLAVPMAWVLAGMALSELPAMLLVAIGLCLQLRALEKIDEPAAVLGLFALSGVALGVAVWGRQPYLLLGCVPVLLALVEPRLRAAVTLFCVVVLALAVPQFVIWQGLVPPSHQVQVQKGLSPINAMLSLGYTGFCFFLLAPRTRWASPLGAALLIAAAIALNAAFGLVTVEPLRGVVAPILPARLLAWYGTLLGGLFLGWGLVFLSWLLRETWRRRDDLSVALLNLGLLCVALSPVFISHQYSSRYTAMSLPYLLLAAEPWRRWGRLTVATTAAGIAFGAMSLVGYFASNGG